MEVETERANPIAYATSIPNISLTSVPQLNSTTFNENGTRDFLMSYNWPMGLQDIFVKNLSKVAYRFFICDDSGSMTAGDGHKLVKGSNGDMTLVSCSRWSELSETLKFHAELARSSSSLTEFRLLNGGPPVMIGASDENDVLRYDAFLSYLAESPGGQTPLCRHIVEVISQIQILEPQLRASFTKVVVVIATDGESSDGDITRAMAPLKDLPVWVVVRLCTDEFKTVNYWNNIDSQLELDMDALDDLCGEAAEVAKRNPWLTYGEPLQRLREFGIPVKELDLLDEARLSLEQIRTICSIIFGDSPDNYPHPEADFAGFVSAVEQRNRQLGEVWNPVLQRMTPWILTENLSSNPNEGAGSTVACCTVS